MAKTTTQQITQEVNGYELKASSLSKKYGEKVDYLLFTPKDSDGNEIKGAEKIVAYIREPNIPISVRAMDFLIGNKPASCGDIMFPYCVLEESDKEIFENKKYGMGVRMHLFKLLETQMPDIKKK